LNNKLKKRNN